MARGYLHRAGLTAERFVPDPHGGPGARMYRSGDLCRMHEDGTVAFLGRLDQQVKLRGHRLELEEIEGRLGEQEGIAEAVVWVRERGEGDQRLEAAVVLSAGQQAVPAGVRGWLKERLPDYMVPVSYAVVEALPRTPNGKLDRRGMRALVEARGAESREEAGEAEGLTELEEVVAGCWKEVLGVERVSRRDHFFALGGHSLLATQLVTRVSERVGRKVPLRLVFEAPRLGEQARGIEGVLRGEGGERMPEIGTVGRSQALPLSFAQQRVWFLDQLEPGSSAYNLPLAVRLTGKLEIEVLERSVREIVQRHEILRTVFDEQQGELVQVILPRGGSELIYEDLRGMREKEAQARLRVQQQAERPFDLRHGPLVRIALLQLDEQEHILLLTLHHIIADGWSLSIFLREITRCYEAFTQSKPVLLPPMPIQYADFAVWQRGWLQGKVLEEQLTYWRRQLHGAVAVELPTDHPRLAMQGSRGARYSFTIPTDLRDALINLGHEEKVTLFMTLLTAFQILLYRYTGQEDIVVGTDIANRNRAPGLAGVQFEAEPGRERAAAGLLLDIPRQCLLLDSLRHKL